METKVIKLSKRYEAHGKTFDAVTVREPRFNDFMDLGEPYESQRANGQVVVIENTATIAAYVKRCVTDPGAECLGELGIHDARAVKEAVTGFFLMRDPVATP